MALPAALAALIVLAALAALSGVAARAALRDASALAEGVQASETRAGLRARAARALVSTARATLLAGPRAIGGADTVVTVTALTWPWHRVVVRAEGTPVAAELALAAVPVTPWCAAVVGAGSLVFGAGTLVPDLTRPCPRLAATTSSDSVGAYGDSLTASLAAGARADSQFISVSAGVPTAYVARRRIDISPGATVIGVLFAPVVHVAGGATVRGIVVARESLVVDPGALVISDRAAVDSGLAAAARLRMVGRSGLLLPP